MRSNGELETLHGQLDRLKPAFERLLEEKTAPDALIRLSDEGSVRAWFLVGALIADLAQINYGRKDSAGKGEERRAGSNESLEEGLVHELRDPKHHDYLRNCVSRYFDHEISELRDTRRHWRAALFSIDGGELPEPVASDSVFQVIASLWEDLIAAGFCEGHRLLAESTREDLSSESLGLVHDYQHLPMETRTGAQWFLRNFRSAVQAETTGRLGDGLARWAARLINELALGGLSPMSDVLEQLAKLVAERAELPPGERESLASLIRGLQAICLEKGRADLLGEIRRSGRQQHSESNGHLGPRSILGNTTAINVIPSKGKAPCLPIVLAIANRTKAANLRSVMKNLRDHLAHCAETRVAVIITDSFDSKWFEDDYLSLVEVYEKQGKQFIVLLQGPGRAGLSPIQLGYL